MSSKLGKPIDFDVVREPWQKYELKDNSVVKTKLIVTRIYKNQIDGKPNYTVDGQTVTVILSPIETRGAPDTTKFTPQDYEKAVIQDDVPYSTISEEWYEYIVDDGARLRIKSTVSRIRKTSLFDKDGNPIYLVDNNMLIQTKLPKIE